MQSITKTKYQDLIGERGINGKSPLYGHGPAGPGVTEIGWYQQNDMLGVLVKDGDNFSNEVFSHAELYKIAGEYRCVGWCSVWYSNKAMALEQLQKTFVEATPERRAYLAVEFK
jgi:hypothetical protein